MKDGDLTPLELQALSHLAQGLSAAQTARRLAVSESTLRRTLRRAGAKLGAVGTTNTIYIAAKSGLI